MIKKFPIYVLTGAFLIILFFFYSLCIVKYNIKVDETIIESQSIPSSFDGVRLVQLSDVLIRNEDDLKLVEKAVHEINHLEADIVLFTGDLFKEGAISSSLSSRLIEILSELNPSLAKLAVLGDQDLPQQEELTEILTSASFKILRNDSIELYNGSSEGVNFIGIDSLSSAPQLDDLLSTLTNGEQFNVLLLHEPTLAAKSTDFPIELQISGHCQGLTTTKGCSQFHQGVYRFADQLTLYVNSGLNRPNQLTTLLKRPTLHSFLLMKK